MTHHLKVDLTPRRGAPLLRCENRSIGLRLWHHLFGRNRIVILVSGESIDAVTIIEQPPEAAHGHRP